MICAIYDLRHFNNNVKYYFQTVYKFRLSDFVFFVEEDGINYFYAVNEKWCCGTWCCLKENISHKNFN